MQGQVTGGCQLVIRQCVLLVIILSIAMISQADSSQQIAGFTKAEALHLGERMYRQGILPNGKPMQAIIAEDIPVDGRTFTCINCHQRSGLGSVEGSVVTWPINGKELFVPRRRTGAWSPSAEGQGPGRAERWSLPSQLNAADARPAYTDETLAGVVRTGIDPTGRPLSRAMPRYQIDDSNIAVLSHYLKSLSYDSDPGVDEKTIRFATIVTEDVLQTDRNAMLAVLQAHIDASNTQTRPHKRRSQAGLFYKTEKYGAYRTLELDVWELKGPSKTWRSQLETYYKKKPVFALLGGISNGSWAPVHEFCEENKIPNIFPLTEQPVVSNSDWYTLYFSKGLYQEGEAAARFLQISERREPGSKILQVYRPGSRSEQLARGFQETWEEIGDDGLTSMKLETEDIPLAGYLQKLIGEHRPSVVLLWLEATEIASILDSSSAGDDQTTWIFASGSLLNGKLNVVPEGIQDRLYLTWPYSISGDSKFRLMALQRWLKARDIPVTNLEIQARMYFLGWMLPEAIKQMRSEFYRDYFLEGFDMMKDQDYAIAIYPRLSFGPGQRYASKGCYIVQPKGNNNNELLKVSNWIIN
jgi:hypothetical protein